MLDDIVGQTDVGNFCCEYSAWEKKLTKEETMEIYVTAKKYKETITDPGTSIVMHNAMLNYVDNIIRCESALNKCALIFWRRREHNFVVPGKEDNAVPSVHNLDFFDHAHTSCWTPDKSLNRGHNLSGICVLCVGVAGGEGDVCSEAFH